MQTAARASASDTEANGESPCAATEGRAVFQDGQQVYGGETAYQELIASFR